MVYGWPIRLLRVLWIAALICSYIQNGDYYIFSVFEGLIMTIFTFIIWIIAALIPLQYILLNSTNPKVLIEDFI